MNYTQEVKKEIEPKLPKQGKECLAFLSAITKTLGSMTVYKDGISLEYDFKDNESVFTVMQILRDYFDCEVECKVHNAETVNFTLYIKDEYSNDILKAMHLLHLENNHVVITTSHDVVKDFKERNEIKSFIQGLFLCCGGVYFPDDVNSKGGYHIELNIVEEDFANEILNMLKSCGLEFSISERNVGFSNYSEKSSSFSVYAKRKNTVCDFLTFIEATDATLYVNDIMLRREINNDINRLSNIEAANTDRKYISNSKYIGAIEVVKDVIGLDGLDPKLVKIAKARLQNHDESMGALAERIGMSKSSVSRALNKIVEMANRIKENKD